MEEKKLKKYILVPVDFSPHSEAAILLASKLAQCFDAVPLVLHVVHDPGDMPGYYAQALKKKHLARIEDGATDMLADFLSRLAKHHKGPDGLDRAESMLVKGLPTNRILEVAERKKAIMIVMGSKGRAGIKHLMLGSVAERVVQMSPIPVTVAKIKNS
jgi:nucleotide-binding universal stress UspA family protein